MRPTTVLLASALGLAAALPAAAAEMLSSADRSFALGVNQGGMFEVKAGSLAAERGTTPVIRDQGDTESHDHNIVNQRLNAILRGSDLTLPDTLDATFSGELSDLKSKSGADFDRTYLDDMKKVHAKDGAAFAQEASGGQNPKLRLFAQQTDAIVKAHVGELDAVQAPQGSGGGQ